MERSSWRVVKDGLWAKSAMVISEHPSVTETAISVLRDGGNAVDAAVAAGFALGVCRPFMSGIGGGGHMVIYDAKGAKTAVVDYNMRAPGEATPDMYETAAGSAGNFGWPPVKDEANAIGHRAVTVPGTVSGLCTALERYGTMPRREVMKSAVSLAEEGSDVDIFLSLLISSWWPVISRFPHTIPLFTSPEGRILSAPVSLAPGGKLVQKELAETLRRVAEGGPEAFYQGETARLMAEEVRRHGGVLSVDDLASYRAEVHEPGLTTEYRGHTVVAVPGPCGGPTVVEALNVMQNFDVGGMGHNSVEALHVVAESLRLSFADRLRLMGDPDYVPVPYDRLTSPDYAKELAAGIDLDRAVSMPPVQELQSAATGEAVTVAGGLPAGETTQLCVVDGTGGAVSMTQTLQTYSGVIPPGTGVALNGAMLWFNPEPGRANSIAGGKRILANMSPIILLKDGKPFLVTGAPGGRKIKSAVAQVVSNVVDHGMEVHRAVNEPRIDCSGTEIRADDRIPEDVLNGLRRRGHQVEAVPEEFLIRRFAGPTGILIDTESGELHGGLCQFDQTDAMGY